MKGKCGEGAYGSYSKIATIFLTHFTRRPMSEITLSPPPSDGVGTPPTKVTRLARVAGIRP
jgi:hypothetical protein